MIVTTPHNGQELQFDLRKPIDISIPLESGEGHVSAWYVDPIRITPVMTDQFTGSVKDGGSVNFRDIYFNPHGHGTHTECVGHISREDFSVNQSVKQFFSLCRVVSIEPEQIGEDQLITAEQIAQIDLGGIESLCIRTLPHHPEKLTKNYSSTNPPFVDSGAMEIIASSAVKHFLIDTPSVDREVDGGALASHHVYWNYPDSPRLDRTITEMVFVPDSVADGLYLLELQFAPFENDASPSRPVIYAKVGERGLSV